MARPPLAAAREHATKQLIEKHKAEHEKLAQDYLEQQGWQRIPVTVHKWKSGIVTGVEG